MRVVRWLTCLFFGVTGIVGFVSSARISRYKLSFTCNIVNTTNYVAHQFALGLIIGVLCLVFCVNDIADFCGHRFFDGEFSKGVIFVAAGCCSWGCSGVVGPILFLLDTITGIIYMLYSAAVITKVL